MPGETGATTGGRAGDSGGIGPARTSTLSSFFDGDRPRRSAAILARNSARDFSRAEARRSADGCAASRAAAAASAFAAADAASALSLALAHARRRKRGALRGPLRWRVLLARGRRVVARVVRRRAR